MNSPYKGKFKVSQQFKSSAHDGLDLVGIDSKKIYSTVNGVVEFAGWENSADKNQGFGLYVRIKQKGTVDRYYFGHLSEIKVKKGQSVEKGELIGTEGSTGKSTGSHCHYCVRGNALRTQIRNICNISGIPNKLGTYSDDTPKTQKIAEKTVTEIAKEVLVGKWGNGAQRKKKLTAAGYSYTAVQKEVNRLSAPKTAAKKSNEAVAREVLAGKWGNGAQRKERLTKAGYSYSAVQSLVNKLSK